MYLILKNFRFINKFLFIFKLLKSQSIADLIFDDFLQIDGKVYKKI